MAKLAILTLSEGNFQQGFRATVEIKEDDGTHQTVGKIIGNLPPAPKLLETLDRWRCAFPSEDRSRLEARSVRVASRDPKLASQLAAEIDEWLNSGHKDWRPIRDALVQNANERVRVILETEDVNLRRLPWQAWDLLAFGNYKKTEFALSPSAYQRPKSRTAPIGKVRIMAVFGYARTLNLELDRKVLEDLRDRDAEITVLKQPPPEEVRQLLREEQWHIFFYAGHSASDREGKIGWFKLNEQDSIAIADLKNALDKAIDDNGLQLAIFNSCDGLGLANQLAKMRLPLSIVMREPVPDEVAPKFLEEFLKAFANNESFDGAVRIARGALEDAFNNTYPGVNWLPAICQNPSVSPPTWQEWLAGKVESAAVESAAVTSQAATLLDALPDALPDASPVNAIVNATEYATEYVGAEAIDSANLAPGADEGEMDIAAKYPTEGSEPPLDSQPDAAPLSPKMMVAIAVLLLAIATISLLASYVWFTSEPWKLFGERGWIVELARTTIWTIQVIYLVGIEFTKETRQLLNFRKRSADPNGILELFSLVCFGLCVCFLIVLVEHHLFSGPQEIRFRFLNSGGTPANGSNPFTLYHLPYLLYLPYSLVNLFYTYFVCYIGCYGALDDLMLLRKESFKVASEIEAKSLRGDRTIMDNFEEYCHKFITTVRRYYFLAAGMSLVVLFESLLGKDVTSDSARSWVLVGIVLVSAGALIIISWGGSHYERVFQATSLSLSKLHLPNDEFEKKYNVIKFFQRIARSNLSIYVCLAMLAVSVIAALWPSS